MRVTPNAARGLLLLAAMSLPTIATAQNGAYGGVGIGPTSTRINRDALAVSGATTTSIARNENSAGGKIFGGYALNSNFAVEAGYVDLGKFKLTRFISAPTPGSIAATSKSSGIFVDLVGLAPLGTGSVSMLGRIGGIASTTNKNIATTGGVTLGAGVDPSPKERETNLKIGAGAQFDINKTTMARAEWERYARLGSDLGTGQTAVDLFSLNLLFRFK
jgi:OmpA-OmpF porin, OOP family